MYYCNCEKNTSDCTERGCERCPDCNSRDCECTTERCCDKVFDCIENNFCKKCDKKLCDKHVFWKDGCAECHYWEKEYEEYLVLWNKNKIYKISPMMTFNEFTEHRKLLYVNLAEDANMFNPNQ